MSRVLPSLVQWHEGMLLSPHHFQQVNNYMQHMFSIFGLSSAGFMYGVLDLQIDSACLSSGVLRVLKTSGIFRDGCSFEYDAMFDQPLERNLNEYFLEHSTPVKIYLAIPMARIGENQVTGDTARYYSSEMESINDENIGDNAINIPVLRPRMRLLLESEVDAPYSCFPIFEAEKSVEGGITGTNFIAPFIVINEHSKISDLCREVTQLIRSKISYFSDRKDNFGQNEVEESLSNLKLLIQALLPLESLLTMKIIQPFEIYKCLLDTISKVISINPTQFIPKMPTYNHEDLFKTFNGITEYAKNILVNLKQQYDIISFEKDGSVFKLQMKKEWLEKDEITIGIQKTFSATEDDLLGWISGLQIASESMLSTTKDRRVLGADRTILERGAYITQPNGMKLLSVKTRNSYIKPGEKLCLLNASHTVLPEGVVFYADS